MGTRPYFKQKWGLQFVHYFIHIIFNVCFWCISLHLTVIMFMTSCIVVIVMMYYMEQYFSI